MAAAGIELYRESFARRIEGMQRPDWTTVDRPGVYGVYGSADNRSGRVLITDDGAAPALEALLPDFYRTVISVFSAARRCREAIQAAGRRNGEPATAMLCRDLAIVPYPPIPTGLAIHTVRRVPGDTEAGVPLEAAAEACLRADPNTADVPLPSFLAFLRFLPDSTTTSLPAAGAAAWGSLASWPRLTLRARFRQQPDAAHSIPTPLPTSSAPTATGGDEEWPPP